MISTLNLPAALAAKGRDFVLRRASNNDLETLMLLLADDPISANRGDKAMDADVPAYRSALAAIIEDPSNEIIVVVDDGGELLGTMQLTRIPGMARRGATRLLVEAVRVRSDSRSLGVGSAMMHWVTGAAAAMVGADLVQLTSDEARTDAHRFYERLGFVGSHRGFKYQVG